MVWLALIYFLLFVSDDEFDRNNRLPGGCLYCNRTPGGFQDLLQDHEVAVCLIAQILFNLGQICTLLSLLKLLYSVCGGFCRRFLLCTYVCNSDLVKFTSDVVDIFLSEWVDLCKSYLAEAKWCHSGYTPSLEEYLENAWLANDLKTSQYFCRPFYEAPNLYVPYIDKMCIGFSKGQNPGSATVLDELKANHGGSLLLHQNTGVLMPQQLNSPEQFSRVFCLFCREKPLKLSYSSSSTNTGQVDNEFAFSLPPQMQVSNLFKDHQFPAFDKTTNGILDSQIPQTNPTVLSAQCTVSQTLQTVAPAIISIAVAQSSTTALYHFHTHPLTSFVSFLVAPVSQPNTPRVPIF
ncbi:hypothetical protein LguiA_025931 [Lonicera macranthoides]